ncbi:hypothetical protein B7463_g12109, partial [Scytalidium lignicola]
MAETSSSADGAYASSSIAPKNFSSGSQPSATMSSSDIALTNEYTPIKYAGIKILKRIITYHDQKLKDGDLKAEYFTISHVSSNDFQNIERRRGELGCKVRFMYLADIQTLIIKLPSEIHERAHRSLGSDIICRADRMGLSRAEHLELGATLYTSENDSKKEADSSYVNNTIHPRPKKRWPSLVIEAGYSESINRLRTDARWWISLSKHAVRIVLLIKVNPNRRRVTIEKWIPDPNPNPRVTRNRGPYPAALVATIAINQSNANASTITGGPLILEFDEVFLRPANNPPEHDIVFSQQDLDGWAHDLWDGL